MAINGYLIPDATRDTAATARALSRSTQSIFDAVKPLAEGRPFALMFPNEPGSGIGAAHAEGQPEDLGVMCALMSEICAREFWSNGDAEALEAFMAIMRQMLARLDAIHARMQRETQGR